MDDLYPPGPGDVPADLTRPTTAYKHRAWLAGLSLAVFLGVYLFLAGWFVHSAYRLLGDGMASGGDGIGSLVMGAGAAFLAIFMVKALFFLQRGGAPDAVEVTSTGQPRLFAFLNRLADEAGAPRPAKVYLSPRVNAAVFSDLSVFNLLFPARKNLEIGLALVNVLTMSELKAVLAHEFGHFAQRSMAIGRWVYVAQQIATQIIARRDALDGFLQGLSRFDLRLAWVGWLLSVIVWSIRSLMDALLRVVVLAQRSLSRQMEFQADLVAVSLTGSDELVHALHKLQAADDAWSRALRFAESEIGQGRLPHDLFEVQTRIIGKTASILNDDTYGRVPPVNPGANGKHRVFKTSFAQPPQMWSTHPSSSDREENAKRVYLPSTHDERSAWLLFDHVERLKTKAVATLVGNDVKAQPATPEDTLRALDQRYGLQQYDTRYRGAYLGRALTRHAQRHDELYGAYLQCKDAQAALAVLYPESLGDDLARLRELDEERLTLQALQEKVFQATGGRLVYRGQEVTRRQLPALIRRVSAEADVVRQRIQAHDRDCRTAHLAAAQQVGGGWRQYLQGLIEVLHFAEHTAADLADAKGLLANVFNVVIADGKVSDAERKRLVKVAAALHAALAAVHQQKGQVRLDSSLQNRLDTGSWSAMLGEFQLSAPDEHNIGEWLRVIDGWTDSVTGACNALATAALELLLLAEARVAGAVHGGEPAGDAPAPSAVPGQYARLLVGQERERQKKLDWWSRFQTADGILPGTARLLVAGGIVSAVLGYSAATSFSTTVSVYNGLGIPVMVHIDQSTINVLPYASAEASVELGDQARVEARTAEGALIETFNPVLEGHGHHYVYNIAAATPLVEWTATYGNAAEVPPNIIAPERWRISSASIFFHEPPQSVSTKGGGATRLVLSGPGREAEPEKVLAMVKSPSEQRRILDLHAQWTSGSDPQREAWQSLSARF
ncbi:Zn-dependent protease with chaperone function [Fluviicoccus keumensis]|uniref:Zn-dependent protease with chaperone function n=1 Tax=Fluviicoccus keumensis TaxID=1435465 RepID=A0A4V2G6A8_9GAMM|nr:M48 family metallopeptidase [Fluviicoccus keumensis]RZU47976.1 Zn-dependent protease with chaperone function [Fluviicoccus keumensis]